MSSTAGGRIMNDIRENGYIRWKGLVTVLGALLATVLTMFLHLDSKIETLSSKLHEQGVVKAEILMYLKDIRSKLHSE